MRPNDTSKGRAIKLTHYIDLHKRLFATVPDDIQLFVRTAADIPVTMKEEIITILNARGWKESPIPNPTLLLGQVKGKKE
jgi:acetyl-CoA decarbonylase/synthase complex subunit alpha